jgi:hypothetical protein
VSARERLFSVQIPDGPRTPNACIDARIPPNGPSGAIPRLPATPPVWHVIGREWAQRRRLPSPSDPLQGAALTDTKLRDLLLARLERDTTPEDEWSALVLAALEGTEELEQLLADSNGDPKEGSPKQTTPQEPTAPRAKPRTAFLRRITAQGFRGIGPEATLRPHPRPRPHPRRRPQRRFPGGGDRRLHRGPRVGGGGRAGRGEGR